METIEELKTRYVERLRRESGRYRQSAARSASQGRTDDANLDKIRDNIVNIFITLADATPGKSYTSYCQGYLARFDTIPASWRQRLTQAQAHSDGTTAAIEMVKLETAEGLRAMFLEEMEADHD